jgi:hypothetical protein
MVICFNIVFIFFSKVVESIRFMYIYFAQNIHIIIPSSYFSYILIKYLNRAFKYFVFQIKYKNVELMICLVWEKGDKSIDFFMMRMMMIKFNNNNNNLIS